MNTATVEHRIEIDDKRSAANISTDGPTLTERTSERLPSLDFLRGLAAISVFIPHFFMYGRQDVAELPELISTMAVEVFFVLSGFVLGPQIVLCAERRNWPTLRTFLIRRWMRTIPSYVVALLGASILFGGIWSTDFLHYLFYVQNLFAQHIKSDYFPIAWSLSVEEWYYVVFPPFLLLTGVLLKPGNLRNYAIAAATFIIIITVIRIVFGDLNDWGASVRRVVIFRIDSIAYGFLLFLAVRHFRFGGAAASRLISGLALAISIAALGYLNLQIADSNLHWPRHAHPFVSAAFGMSALAFCLSFNAWFSAPYIAMVSTYLGRISYPAYLFHLVILYALFQSRPELHNWGSFALYTLAVLAFSTVFFYFVERAILDARPHYPK